MSSGGLPSFEVPPSLLAAATSTRSRLRLSRALLALAKWLPVAVLVLTPLAISYRYQLISGRLLLVGAIFVALSLAALLVREARRGPGLLEATLRLDAAHRLKGRLAAALEYAGAFGRSRNQPGDDDGFVAVIVGQARELGPLAPEVAAPLAVPRTMIWGALMLVCFAFLLAVPDRSPPPSRVASSAKESDEHEPWLIKDDAELLKAESEALAESVHSEQAKAAAERFNEIVLKAVAGEIDQAEAFRLAAELQADLDSASEQAAELAQGLEKRGTALERRDITRALGRNLKDRKYKEAEEALRRLAERLASDKEPLSKKELDDLRASLEEMRGEIETQTSQSKDASDSATQEEQALSERQKRLLQKKKEGTLSEAEKQELERNERQLKRLSRQKKQKQSAQKTLSELDKQLAEAARELQQERKKAGEFMDQAARTLSEGTQKQLTDKEKKELIKQLKAMKERLRRQNQDGKQSERLREFQRRARGQGDEQGEQGKKPGGAQRPGAGQARLGPGGAPLPMPGQGKGPGDQPGTEAGTGKEPGSAHDPQLSGEDSRLEGAGTEDKTAVAQDTGQGQSASETIVSAAEEGFVSSSYETLYRDYETVAEEVMDKDAIPAGRKAHVLRYFELIRPRGGVQKSQGDP